MTECDEVAAAMLDKYQTQLTEAGAESSMDAARALVDKEMAAEESATIRGNVAESLHIQRRQQERMLRTARGEMEAFVHYWEKRGVILAVSRHSPAPLAMRNTVAVVDVRLKRGN